MCVRAHITIVCVRAHHNLRPVCARAHREDGLSFSICNGTGKKVAHGNFHAARSHFNLSNPLYHTTVFTLPLNQTLRNGAWDAARPRESTLSVHPFLLSSCGTRLRHVSAASGSLHAVGGRVAHKAEHSCNGDVVGWAYLVGEAARGVAAERTPSFGSA